MFAPVIFWIGTMIFSSIMRDNGLPLLACAGTVGVFCLPFLGGGPDVVLILCGFVVFTARSFTLGLPCSLF